MPKEPTPVQSKTQKAVAVNKAAQQARTQRVAETTTKLQKIQSKGVKTPPPKEEKPAATAIDPFNTPEYLALLDLYNRQSAENQLAAERAAETARAQRIDAFELLKSEMANLGVPEFGPLLEQYLKQGVSVTVAPTLLEGTDVYKQRFAGNLKRREKGLPELDMASYINAEREYRQLLKSNGLDALDNKETYSSLIGGDVSLAEAQERIEKVYNKIDTADATLKENINKYFSQYGVSDPTIQKQQVAQAILGGAQAASSLQKSLQKAQLRAGAQMAGVTVGEAAIEELQKQVESQNVADVYGLAKQGFGTLAQTQSTTEKLAQIYGEDVTNLQPELQQEAFFGLASQRRKKLQEKETATFAGKSGVSSVSLTQQSTAGQL